MIQTNWYVITGGPSSGKSKTIEYLAFLGHPTVPESARVLIDMHVNQGRSIKEIRADEKVFQRKILEMKIDAEKKILPGQITFFDRGIPDSLAYYRFFGDDTDPVLKACTVRKYKGVFLLDPLPFEHDYARVENRETAITLHTLLDEAYTSLGYEVIRVPVMPISERAELILSKIGK